MESRDNKIERDTALEEQVIAKLNLFFGGSIKLSASKKCNIIEFSYVMPFDAIKNYMDVLKKIGLTIDRGLCALYFSGYRLEIDRIQRYYRDSNYLIIRNTLAEILEKFNRAVDEVTFNDKQRSVLLLGHRRGIRCEHLIGKSWFNSDEHVNALLYLINDITVDAALAKIKDLTPAQLKNIENESALTVTEPRPAFG